MKKIICLVLALIMVLSMGVTVLAATSNNVGSVPEHDHTWTDWYEDNGFWKRTCTDCGITEIRPDPDGDVDEKNPNTGASGILAVTALVSAAAVASFKRK